MSDICQCGHVKDRHGEHWDGCKYCECEAFTPAPAPPADDGKQWLDAPSEAGHWFRLGRDGTVKQCHTLEQHELAMIGNYYPGSKFQRIPPPAPPAPPLPRERQVTLTAKVKQCGPSSWFTGIYVQIRGAQPNLTDNATSISKQAAIDFAREYGCEPTVEGEPA